MQILVKQAALQKVTQTVNELEPQLCRKTHYNIRCDGCLAMSIRGKRFHCLECKNFNLCARCEKRIPHEHPMVRYCDPVPTEIVENIGVVRAVNSKFAEGGKNTKLMLLKLLAGKGYESSFYEYFVDKHADMDLNSFVIKASHVFC